jgi:hypothetical protein
MASDDNILHVTSLQSKIVDVGPQTPVSGKTPTHPRPISHTQGRASRTTLTRPFTIDSAEQNS